MHDHNTSQSLIADGQRKAWFNIEDDLMATSMRAEDKPKSVKFECHPHTIVLICCLEGRMECKLPWKDDLLELHPNEASMLVYPREQWQCQVRLRKAHVAMFAMSLQKLHDILAVRFDQAKMQKAPSFDYRMLPDHIPFSPALQTQIKSIFQNTMEHPFREIFQKAKFLELFSTLMNQAFHTPVEDCPFVISMELEEKLADVRRSINQSLDQLPDIGSLAVDNNLPKSMLQKGFKYVYGKTIHSYYQDLRMDQAKAMIESGQFLVKEIAYELGYQNPSHFISAFKKRFGSTPKQYAKQL